MTTRTTIHVVQPVGQLALAAPFLITVIAILCSAALAPVIADRLAGFFAYGWTAEELASVMPDRAPQTLAMTATWSIDMAQLPSLIAVPASVLFALRDSYEWVFIASYALTAIVIISGLSFLRSQNIARYSKFGIQISGYQLTPITIFGLLLNLLAAAAAAFLT